MGNKFYLVGEFFVFLLLPPLLTVFDILPNAPIPFLICAACLGWFLLMVDKTFDRAVFFRFPRDGTILKQMLLRFIISAAALISLVYLFYPDLAFSFPREKPKLWLVVMLLYPVFSVYPQELIYRTLIFHRYRQLFPSEQTVILASAITFGLVHMIMGNLLAVLISFVGGVIFAKTYSRSNSLLLVSLEHALYGQLIFTIGLGQFFFHGNS